MAARSGQAKGICARLERGMRCTRQRAAAPVLTASHACPYTQIVVTYYRPSAAAGSFIDARKRSRELALAHSLIRSRGAANSLKHIAGGSVASRTQYHRHTHILVYRRAHARSNKVTDMRSARTDTGEQNTGSTQQRYASSAAVLAGREGRCEHEPQRVSDPPALAVSQVSTAQPVTCNETSRLW